MVTEWKARWSQSWGTRSSGCFVPVTVLRGSKRVPTNRAFLRYVLDSRFRCRDRGGPLIPSELPHAYYETPLSLKNSLDSPQVSHPASRSLALAAPTGLWTARGKAGSFLRLKYYILAECRE